MSAAKSAFIFALLVVYAAAASTQLEPTPTSVQFRTPDVNLTNHSSTPSTSSNIGFKSPMPVHHNIVTCTRVWLKNKDGWVRVEKFIEQALGYSDYVIVAVRTELDSAGTFEHLQELARFEPRLIPLSVTPWIDTTGPLNALLNVAGRLGKTIVPQHFDQYARNDIEFVLFQSIEIDSGPEEVTKLMSFINSEKYSDVLSAGASLEGSHDFSPGMHTLRGLTSPWNTFCLWHISTLAKFEFLAVSDGLAGPTGSAIEEPTTSSMFQHHKFNAKAGTLQRYHTLLVRLPSVSWRNDWSTAERKAQHALKMESKDGRATRQLEALGIGAGIVEHIDASKP